MAATLLACAAMSSHPKYTPIFPTGTARIIRCSRVQAFQCVEMKRETYEQLIHQLVAACYALGNRDDVCKKGVIAPE